MAESGWGEGVERRGGSGNDTRCRMDGLSIVFHLSAITSHWKDGLVSHGKDELSVD